jgi:hypothetical protein
MVIAGLITASVASAQNLLSASNEPQSAVQPPTPRFVSSSPLKNLPPVILDTYGNGFGTAQKSSREKGLQGRVLWIDATANIVRANSEQKVVDLVKLIRKAGFNTIVVDIKPIVGYTMYPSKYSAKLTEWKGVPLPADFDPLKIFVREGKAAGLSVLVSMNAFSEGHRDVQKGLGYEKPDWQTTLYEPKPFVRSSFQTRPTYNLWHTTNQMPPSDENLAVFTEVARVPPRLGDDALAVIVDNTGKVVAKAEGASIRQLDPNIPSGGSVVLGTAKAAQFLRMYAQPGDKLEFDSSFEFVKISERPMQQVPLMLNPNHPAVQQRMMDMVKEVLTNYEIDGLLFDDRLRYGGMNADFSDYTRREFEQYLSRGGQGVVEWPRDVFTWTVQPNMTRGLIPGPLYEQWLTFRAQSISQWIGKVRKLVDTTKPGTLFGVYAGSWYGEYPTFGSNYAANDFSGAFWFLRPEYQKTGFAGQLDLLITGCYYNLATLADAMAVGQSLGVTIEAGGQQSNRAAADLCWTYAGISLASFKDNPQALMKALQAAVASTQGVMVFDLSHNMEQFWSVFEQAFAEPMKAPHSDRALLDWVRGHRDPKMKLPATLFGGAAGAGM